MPTSPAFGRRANLQLVARPTKPRNEFRAPVETKMAEPPPVEMTAAPIEALPSLDDELREWKRNRKSGFQIPWRQFSLMASLCFGVASLVLPDGVNGVVNWLLYALMAASFVAGISRRRRKRAEASSA